ncbi:aldehyde ferredoxin oxidoreductase family protein [Williamwhitmania taraxaci]|uniref:Aldehyde:ferredoxin oxidoreductase n=2 Tax=Williamwhitmania taraxaci TaxID=1640674 RepID=A0A1G6GVC5_9BACT|nr:aldehyde ferredoxin oxidoreductase C-terminal domain-containing protein [Williamwhitmania taraxaci]SDB85645.1 aldehyde:ferredoxin oxidoreductase [Williamwhitmania taraxaci]
MKKGYHGKILWIDLTAKTHREEVIDDKTYELFLGGYGLASKIIFDHQKPKLPPLHPDNILGIMSGLLTNGRAVFNGRWMLAGRSPLTGTWGDANSGGDFAPAIKNSGYDGFFITGKSAAPVYLLINDSKVEILDAHDLWMKKDAVETESFLKTRHGADYKAITIGAGGEHLSLISGVVNAKGRLAGRSGFGALMGSKNLKAICVKGSHEMVVHDSDAVWNSTSTFLTDLVNNLNDFGKTMKNSGTAGTLTDSAESGDSPVKNWVGVGTIDFPESMANKINAFDVTKYEVEKYACYGCPFGCGGICELPGKKLLKETHRPEYETLCGFGVQLINDNVESIFMANELCNRAGVDSISCATTLNWAFEAYEKGFITLKQTGGIPLEWGNADSVVKMVDQMVNNHGFGKNLKDGVRQAVINLGIPQMESAAMHVHGQELPMHDSRNTEGGLSLGIGYEVEPTPGRHTSTFSGIDEYIEKEQKDEAKLQRTLNRHFGKKKLQSKYTINDQISSPDLGTTLKNGSCAEDIINALGLCNFGFYLGPMVPFVEWINGTTGWKLSLDDCLTIGQRIKTVRHAFNIREGIDMSKMRMPERARGNPTLTQGPNAYSPNVLMWDDAKAAYFTAMGWDPTTTKPLEATLDKLNLPTVKHQLYGN